MNKLLQKIDLNEFIAILKQTLHTNLDGITNITPLEQGMTNDSFIFTYQGKRYIMRVPGKGTSALLSREDEYENYQAIAGKHLGEHVLYLNPTNGYKLSAFIENARNCDPYNWHDVHQCMQKLHYLHNLKLTVNHTFDLYEHIDHYEQLWQQPSRYADYQQTKQHIYALRNFIEQQPRQWVLTHIDANYDNFLFTPQRLYLIDWEYAGMQDPDVDIAMFAIYAGYDHQEIDRLIDDYFNDHCPLATRIKIYCYIATGGLLWSNWCESKREAGVNFDNYDLQQYHYAQTYYQIAQQLIEEHYGK